MKKLILLLTLTMMFGQTELTTRVYELPRINFQTADWYELDIESITGYELDYAQIKIVKVIDYSIDNNYAYTNIMHTLI